MTLRSFFRMVRSILYPHICPVCGTLYDGAEDALCAQCRKQYLQDKMRPCQLCMQEHSSCQCRPDKRFHAVSAYLHLVPYRCKTSAGVMPRMKTENCSEAFVFVAQELTERLKTFQKEQQISNKDCVVTYVPRLPKNVTRYGYDQAEQLARRVGRAMDCPTARLLYHSYGTFSQKKLHADERFANAMAHFRLADHAEQYAAGKTVILIDDVITTGSSVNACAYQLKKTGCSRVIALTFAKTEKT